VKNLIFFLIIIVSGFFQTTILNCIGVFGVKPDLLLCCVILAGAFFNRKWALIFSLSAGIIKDIFSSGVLGLNLLLFYVWNYCIVILSRRMSIDDSLVLGVLGFAVVFLNGIIIRFIYLFSGRDIPLGIFLRITLIESVYTALSLSLLIRILNHFRFFPIYKNSLSKNRLDEVKSF
jgi:rod shape-determining protein MreD